MQYRLMQDTTTPNAIGADPWAVAGYNGGLFPDYPQLVRLFPHAYHALIDVFFGQSENADVADAEKGDFTLPQAAAWLPKARPVNLLKPCDYTSASNIEELVFLIEKQGMARGEFFIWSAHYTGIPHICGPHTCGYPQADFTQFTDHQFSRNIDGSMVPETGIFKPTAKVPLPADPHHYRWFASSDEGDGLPGGPFVLEMGHGTITVDERATVRRYDALRKQANPAHLGVHKHELDELMIKLTLLAGRVMNIAYEQAHLDVVPWNDFRRFGWRRDQLELRSRGIRLV